MSPHGAARATLALLVSLLFGRRPGDASENTGRCAGHDMPLTIQSKREDAIDCQSVIRRLPGDPLVEGSKYAVTFSTREDHTRVVLREGTHE